MKQRVRGKFYLLKNELVHQSGYESLAVWVVMVALQDAEMCIKSEFRPNKDFFIKNPDVNLYEIRQFMEYGLFTKLFNADGGVLLDEHINITRAKMERKYNEKNN